MRVFVEQVAHQIERHGLIGPGEAVVAAVSGGIDSMVMLDVLCRRRERDGGRLVVAHFNHRLRGRASDADQRFVERAARRLGLEFVTGAQDVQAYAQAHKVSIEMGARTLRHAFLAQAAIERGARVVALAHHADDQAELFLLRLLRGSGGHGLGAMRWQGASPADPRITLVRPLLSQSRSDLVRYARAQGLAFRQDATNRDTDLLRNRVRHKLIPLLERGYQPAAARVLWRTAEIVGSESDLVEDLAERWLASGRRTRFDRLHPAIQRQVIRHQLAGLGIEPDFQWIESLRLEKNRPVAIRPGWIVRRNEQDRIEKAPARPRAAAPRDRRRIVRLEGRTGSLVYGGLRIRWRLESWRRGRRAVRRGAAGVERFDAAQMGPRLILRHWQPGDRFQPIHWKQSVKLKDWFSSQKVPPRDRRLLVVALNAAGRIVWIENQRIAEDARITARTARCLVWEFDRFERRAPGAA